MGTQDSETDDTREESTDGDATSQSEDPLAGLSLSRRSALASLVGIGGLGLASNPVAAKKVKRWKKDRDAQGNELFNLGALAMEQNKTKIVDFAGSNLIIDSNNVLNATGRTQWEETDSDNLLELPAFDGTDVDTVNASTANTDTLSDNGSGSINLGALVDADTNELKQLGALAMQQNKTKIVDFAGSNLTIDSNNVLNATGRTQWEETDSDNLLELPAFGGIDVDTVSASSVQTPRVGTVNSTALEGVVDDERFLRVEPTPTDLAPNILGGHSANSASGSVFGATIAGGGQKGSGNTVDANYGVIGGGYNNTVSGDRSFLGSGDNNTASGELSVLGGGLANDASGDQSVVGGGNVNQATAFNSAVLGGFSNLASGPESIVGGGNNNEASGNKSVVGGGVDNAANSNQATVGGGNTNEAGADVATVSGGDSNEASAQAATVGGGSSNKSDGQQATVGGGGGNTASATDSTIGGGNSNEAVDDGATVGGGTNNEAGDSPNVPDGTSKPIDGNHATIGGGEGNIAGYQHSTVGGGNGNEAADEGATIGGGKNNEAGDSPNAPDMNKPINGNYATIGGGEGNIAAYQHSTVGGGKGNEAFGRWTTIAGGEGNFTRNKWCTVGGGINNEADTTASTVGGGSSNEAGGQHCTVAGGAGNEATGRQCTVGGGGGNSAGGDFATVPGGFENIADTGGFAAGVRAWTDRPNDTFARNAFVWNDSSEYHSHGDFTRDGLSATKPIFRSVEPTGNNTFHASATGGFRFITGNSTITYIPGGSAGWTTISSRAAKTNIDPVDSEAVLDEVSEMEVATWEYTDDDGDGQGVRHIGPMAEDFHEAVDIGESDEYINSINADGVAFAAIQGLSTKLDEKDARIEDQRDRIDKLESTVERKDAEVDALRDDVETRDERIEELETANEQLQERLSVVEDRLARLEADQASTSADD